MSVTSLAKRVADLEAKRGRPPVPGAPPPWLAWATGGEVDQLEALSRAVETGEREPTEADQLLCIEVEARATRAMLTGEPPA
jgi:hypothetical protein